MTLPNDDMQETEDWLERLTLAADSLPPGEERDGFMRELLEIRESLAAISQRPKGILPKD